MIVHFMLTPPTLDFICEMSHESQEAYGLRLTIAQDGRPFHLLPVSLQELRRLSFRFTRLAR